MTRVVVLVGAVNKTLFALKKITSVNLPSDWDFRSFLLLLFFFSIEDLVLFLWKEK